MLLVFAMLASNLWQTLSAYLWMSGLENAGALTSCAATETSSSGRGSPETP